MIRSNYNYSTLDNVLYIIDENLGGMSVTNDMENVLEDIQKTGLDISNYKIMYRDSEGIWDGIQLKNTNPIEINFFTIGTTDFYEAMTRIKGYI